MRIKYIIKLSLLAVFIISCSSNMRLAGNSESSKVENVSFEQNNDIVTIYYDLISDSQDTRFNVELLLEYENEQVIELNSSSVQGDIGSEITPGSEKKITWNVLEDYPNGLESDQIQFAINAWQPINNNRKWLYIAAGALALGAGITAAILLTNGSTNQSSGLPLPPSRPDS